MSGSGLATPPGTRRPRRSLVRRLASRTLGIMRRASAAGRTPLVVIRRDLLLPLLARRGWPVRFRVGGVSFVMAASGGEVIKAWSGRRFERREIEFILRALQPGMTFFDIGANAGLFTVPAAMRPGVQVHAFEPCRPTFAVLERNIALNRLTNVRPHRLALADRAGQAVLRVHRAGLDGHNTLGLPADPRAVVSTERVAVTTLDDFCRDQGIPWVDVMKIDVEGAELPVLRGGVDLLGREDGPLLLYESHPGHARRFGHQPRDVRSLLESLGYQVLVLNRGAGSPVVRPLDDADREAEAFLMMVAVKRSRPTREWPG